MPIRVKAPPRSSKSDKTPSSATLKIWEQETSRENVPWAEMTRLVMNGRVYRMRHWTSEAWNRTPEHDRPKLILPGDKGGRFSIEADILV